jgi:flagellar biosynthesis protein FliQ
MDRVLAACAFSPLGSPSPCICRKTMEFDATELVRAALLEALVLALPILGAGLLIGLVISLFQAVTQIQEQTLVFVPKILVMVVVALVLLGWLTMRMVEFAGTMFTW